MSPLHRRKMLRMLGMTLAGSGASALAGFGYGTRIETEWLKLERVTIPVGGLGDSLDGFRIALLSDFHLYPNTRIELIAEAVRMANRLKPDLAALAGDFVLGTADSIFELAPVLARLNARHGVFSILGNHDHWKGAGVVVEGLTRSGIPVLRNQGLALGTARESLYLAGLDDGWVGRHDLASALRNHRPGVPALLLMHEPDFADAFAADRRITLQLSGHSHGGQVRFPLIGSPFLPPYGRRYDQGLYRVAGMWLYTTRGVGVTAPIRINCRPEVTEITLRRA